MLILVAYASTEGQTRKIARFCADRLIARGYNVELLPLTDFDADDSLDITRFDAALLAGSVHGGRLQPCLARFAALHGSALAMMPDLFLMVSRSAAGDDAAERADLDRIARDFAQTTGWTPDELVHVAGAFRFTQYDFFKGLAMRWIARNKGEAVEPNTDKEYTDWETLAALMARWPG